MAVDTSGLSLGYLPEGRFGDAWEVARFVFGEPSTADIAAAEWSVLDNNQVLVVTDGDIGSGPVVGTASFYGFDLTVPGGATVPVAGVTNVGVLPTHRRRGILRQLMVRAHDDFAAAGMAASVLNATDARIYGRFGYGVASRYASVVCDPPRSAFVNLPEPRRLELMRSADAADVLPGLYAAAAPHRPATLSRSAAWWQMMLAPTAIWKGGGHHEVVVAHPDGEDPGGYALFHVEPRDEKVAVTVREVVAATPATHAALWRFLADIDLSVSLSAEVPVDDALSWLLDDPRALSTTQIRDFLFVRVLDTSAVLTARSWRAPVDLVIDIDDPFRPDGRAAGRFHVRGGPRGVTCEPASGTPCVSLGVEALGSVVLGGADVAAMAAAGRITGHRPGAIVEMDLAFGWSPEPFCATRF